VAGVPNSGWARVGLSPPVGTGLAILSADRQVAKPTLPVATCSNLLTDKKFIRAHPDGIPILWNNVSIEGNAPGRVATPF